MVSNNSKWCIFWNCSLNFFVAPNIFTIFKRLFVYFKPCLLKSVCIFYSMQSWKKKSLFEYRYLIWRRWLSNIKVLVRSLRLFCSLHNKTNNTESNWTFVTPWKLTKSLKLNILLGLAYFKSVKNNLDNNKSECKIRTRKISIDNKSEQRCIFHEKIIIMEQFRVFEDIFQNYFSSWSINLFFKKRFLCISDKHFCFHKSNWIKYYFVNWLSLQFNFLLLEGCQFNSMSLV